MPCNTVLTNTVKLDAEKVQFDLLVKAVSKLYGGVSADAARKTMRWGFGSSAVSYEAGNFTSRMSESTLQDLVAGVKQEYAAQVIAKNVLRFGWVYKETTPTTTVNRRA
jgi:hypothetical protein